MHVAKKKPLIEYFDKGFDSGIGRLIAKRDY